MIKHLFYIVLLFLTPYESVINAQSMVYPEWRIGASPSALANLHPALQLSIDRKISDVVNFSADAGYVFSSSFNGRGFRLRPGIERMLLRGEIVSLTGGLHINYRHSWEFNQNINRSTNGEFVFIDYNNKVVRRLIGINLSEDLMFKLNNRWFLELGSGVGFGSYKVTRDFELVQETDFSEFNNFGVQQTIPLFPVFYIHVNVSYALSL